MKTVEEVLADFEPVLKAHTSWWRQGDPPAVDYMTFSPERPDPGDIWFHADEQTARQFVAKQKFGRVYRVTFYPPNIQESLRIEVLPR